MRPRWARERGLRAVTATSASSVRVCGGHALVFFFLKRVFWMLTLTPPSLDGLSNGYITSFNLPVTWPALSPTGTRESYFSGILEISLCSSLLSQSLTMSQLFKQFTESSVALVRFVRMLSGQSYNQLALRTRHQVITGLKLCYVTPFNQC